VKRHRYETAYRERDIAGVLPVTLGEQEFDKEGKLRVFTLELKQDGTSRQQLYKYNPPLVRKVYAAGEEPPPRPHRKKEAAQKARATFHSRHHEA
jgi:hypothetical protein